MKLGKDPKQAQVTTIDVSKLDIEKPNMKLPDRALIIVSSERDHQILN